MGEREDFDSGSPKLRDWRCVTGTTCDTDSCSGCSWFSNSGGIKDEGGGGGTVKDGGDVYVFSFSVSVSGSASVSISVFVSMSSASFVVGRTGKVSKSVRIEEGKGVSVIEG